MDMNDIELRLLAGMPINIDGGLYYIPIVKDIIDIGESTYRQYLYNLLFSKNNIQGDFDKDIDDFYLLCFFYDQDNNFANMFNNALKFIFKEDVELVSDDDSIFFLFSNGWKLDHTNFKSLQEIIKISNHLKSSEEENTYKPANKAAQKMIDMLMKSRKENPKPKPKETMNLHSIISGLAWKSNDMKLDDILNLTIYQLYDGFHRVERIDNYHYTLSGIYAGTVDGKKININNIHWTKILNKEE